MAEYEGIKLNPDNQLLLEGPSLRLPYELSRRNLKTAQKHIEKERDHVLATLKSMAKGSASGGGLSKEQTVAHIDSMINRVSSLKRKLEELEAERKELDKQEKARIEHLGELWDIPTVSDVKYEAWSQVRLNRLLVDYMLRKGYTESAALLAEEKGISDLVDIDLFTAAQRVASSLRNGSLTEALAWCSEHKPLIKNLKTASAAAAAATATNPTQLQQTPSLDAVASNEATDRYSDIRSTFAGRVGPNALTATTAPPPSSTSLEFQLRLQQYINLLYPPAAAAGGVRDLVGARAHAAKYLTPHIADPMHQNDVLAAGMLLITPPECPPLPYAGYFSPARWAMLAELFTATFLELWGLPRDAGLKRALKAGLTALKTPSCHSRHATAANSSSAATTLATATTATTTTTGTQTRDGAAVDGGKDPSSTSTSTSSPPGTVPGARLCPICSTELNALAKDLPYAHHSQSLVDPDPVVLPNDRIYGRKRLEDFAEKMGVQDGTVKDPVTGEEFSWTQANKVYIM